MFKYRFMRREDLFAVRMMVFGRVRRLLEEKKNCENEMKNNGLLVVNEENKEEEKVESIQVGGIEKPI